MHLDINIVNTTNPGNILIILIGFILFSIICISFIGNGEEYKIKKYSLLLSVISFLISLLLLIAFDRNHDGYQFESIIYLIPSWSINIHMGIDGISIFFVLLTTLIVPVCLLASWHSVTKYVKEYQLCFLVLELILLLVFSSLDILSFYIFFESVLIPMFLIIGIWGSRERKIHAAFQFFLYTLVGSVLMLLGIMYIYNSVGTTDLQVILLHEFTEKEQVFLWLSFFISFAVKVPMYPVHIWLPEAHVEAPTAGSVILAGILLKLGTYGLLRFSLPLFPFANTYFTPLVYTMSIIAIVYVSFITMRQVDLKKIIAYSSVAHMGFVTLGLYTFNIEGVEGSILLMISHGFVSSALFLLIGILYDQHHTRVLKYYSGLTMLMPIYSLFFLFFTFANISLPGTSSFVAEFLVLVSTYKLNTVTCFLGALGTILGAAYALWLYNRIAFGVVNVKYILPFKDVSYREFSTLFPFLVLVILMGIYPSCFIDTMHSSLVQNMSYYI